MNRKAPEIDDFIERVVLGRLTKPDVLARLAPPQQKKELAQLKRRERELRSLLNGLAEAYASREIDRQQLASGSQRLQSELAAVQKALADLTVSSEVGSLLAAGDVERAWNGADKDRRRAIIRAVLKDIRIMPAGQGARRFDPLSILVTWRP